VQPALCIGVIVIAILLFWFGIAKDSSDGEAIRSQIEESEKLYGYQNLAEANESLSSESKAYSVAQQATNVANKLSLSGKGMVKRVFFFEINSSEKAQPRPEKSELMNFHLRVLRGKMFADRLTKSIESSEAAEAMLLQPFQGESIILGNVQIVQSLFSPRISNMKGEKQKLSISLQAKNDTAADLFVALFKRSYIMMLQEEIHAMPLLPSLHELTQALRRKKDEVESLRAQIHKQQKIKPVSSVEEIAVRAELNQCEDELANSIRQLSEIQKARKQGASTKEMARLRCLSRNTKLNDYLNNLRQLETFSNAPSNQTPSVREELKRQIALGEETLHKELLRIITELKDHCDKSLKRRNVLRESLVDIAKTTKFLHKESSSFKLLEIREKELETLKNRHQIASEKWAVAKSALLVSK